MSRPSCTLRWPVFTVTIVVEDYELWNVYYAYEGLFLPTWNELRNKEFWFFETIKLGDCIEIKCSKYSPVLQSLIACHKGIPDRIEGHGRARGTAETVVTSVRLFPLSFTTRNIPLLFNDRWYNSRQTGRCVIYNIKYGRCLLFYRTPLRGTNAYLAVVSIFVFCCYVPTGRSLLQ